MYAESNKAVCRRFIQKIFNEGELSLMRDFMASDAVNHELADAMGDGTPPVERSIEWMTDLVFLYRFAFPDLHMEIRDQIADGDRVVTSLRLRGTQKNALMTIAASGKSMDIAGIRIDRFANGKIVESWFHLDTIGMLRQLGAMPELNRKPKKTAPASQKPAPAWRLPAADWASAVGAVS